MRPSTRAPIRSMCFSRWATTLKLFVRDRGVGFDRSLVGADRAGIRDSIERRLTQVGGTVALGRHWRHRSADGVLPR